MVSQCNMYTWMKACFTEFTTFIFLCNRTTAVKHCQKMAVLHLRTSSELSKAFLTKKSKSGIPTWEYLFDNGPSFVRPVKLFFLLYKCISFITFQSVYNAGHFIFVRTDSPAEKSLAYNVQVTNMHKNYQVTQYTRGEKGVGIKRAFL